MKRLLLLLAATTAIVLGGVAPAHADTSSFTFTSFDAQYRLSRDAGGHAVLDTVETLVAQFPQFDQNHGITRDLVRAYDGHPTFLTVTSVTDATGASLPYGTSSSGDVLELKIGDADTYVHGAQTYVIRYSQQYVTHRVAAADEFFWDTNGTSWRQPFEHVSATLTIATGLVSKLNGKVASYAGSQGSNGVGSSFARNENTFLFTAGAPLAAGQNLSIAVGFAPNTFTPKPSGFFDSPWPILAFFSMLLSGLALVLTLVLRATRLADAPGRGIIVAQYVAPKGVSLALSAVILGRRATAKITPAMIISLAVNGNLRILELESTRRGKPTYELQFITADGLGPDELEFMHALFGATFEPEEVHSLDTNDVSAAKQIAALASRVSLDATAQGYRRARPWGRIALIFLLAVGSGILTVVFSLRAIDQEFGGALPIAFPPIVVILFLSTVPLLGRLPLDTKGVELRDYLKGLQVYIELAEEDRLRYLQSPQGAEKTAVATNDKAAIVTLNEKLLPYAVLFGNETEWAKQLGKYYEDTGTQPNWYRGSTAFSAVYFASTVGSINASARSSFVDTSSSSSSGSGGGGFSGGGGGGGGGGGW
ncbi:hypothetical protein BH11ACT2_BH11ACT2_01090 [soil metagenome]